MLQSLEGSRVDHPLGRGFSGGDVTWEVVRSSLRETKWEKLETRKAGACEVCRADCREGRAPEVDTGSIQVFRRMPTSMLCLVRCAAGPKAAHGRPSVQHCAPVNEGQTLEPRVTKVGSPRPRWLVQCAGTTAGWQLIPFPGAVSFCLSGSNKRKRLFP